MEVATSLFSVIEPENWFQLSKNDNGKIKFSEKNTDNLRAEKRVYVFFDQKEQKYLIGKTEEIAHKRISRYFSDSFNKTNSEKEFYRNLRERTTDFSVGIITHLGIYELGLSTVEDLGIYLTDSVDNGYNMRRGGGGGSKREKKNLTPDFDALSTSDQKQVNAFFASTSPRKKVFAKRSRTKTGRLKVHFPLPTETDQEGGYMIGHKEGENKENRTDSLYVGKSYQISKRMSTHCSRGKKQYEEKGIEKSSQLYQLFAQSLLDASPEGELPLYFAATPPIALSPTSKEMLFISEAKKRKTSYSLVNRDSGGGGGMPNCEQKLSKEKITSILRPIFSEASEEKITEIATYLARSEQAEKKQIKRGKATLSNQNP